MTVLEEEFPDVYRSLMMKDDAEKLMKRFMKIQRDLGSMVNADDKSRIILSAYINEMKLLFNDGRNLGF